MMDGLKAFEKFKNVVIVRSNHDDFLDRWLKNEDWKKQPTFKNSRLYMQLSDMLLEQYGTNPYKIAGVIPALINQKFPKFKTLGRSASYQVKGGWELGQHGDVGANGSLVHYNNSVDLILRLWLVTTTHLVERMEQLL